MTICDRTAETLEELHNAIGVGATKPPSMTPLAAAREYAANVLAGIPNNNKTATLARAYYRKVDAEL